MPFASLNLGLLSGNKDKQERGGKTDLLLRFFDSQFFDEWICISYLYKNNQQGIQDYLCNRLYEFPEQGIERYLSQLTQLVVQRQSASLDKVVVDLCARSLRIAVKTYWLLLAISQDQPRNKHVADVRDRCEQAALEGTWEPPFRDTKLLPHAPSARSLHGPLSPNVVSPPRSPGPRDDSNRSLQQQLDEIIGMSTPPSTTPGDDHTTSTVPAPHNNRVAMTPSRDAFGSPEGPQRSLSPDVLVGRAMYTMHGVQQHLEQLAFFRAPTSAGGSTAGSPRGSDARPLSPVQRERHGKLQVELGEGEGVSALLEKSYTANGLVTMAEEDEHGLFSPTNSPRLRQTTFGATLDFVEALCTASSGLTSFAQEDRPWALCRALDAINKEIEIAARNGVAIWFPMGRRNDRVVRLVSNEVTILNSREKAPFLLYVEVINGDPEDDRHTEGALSPQFPLSPHMSFIIPNPDTPILPPPPQLQTPPTQQGGVGAGGAPGGPPGVSPGVRSPPPGGASGVGQGHYAAPSGSSSKGGPAGGGDPVEDDEDPFTRGLNSALAGLRGEGPLVQVQLQVIHPTFPPDPSPTSPSSSSRGGGGGHDGEESEGGGSERATMEGGKALGLLSRWGLRGSFGASLRKTDPDPYPSSAPSTAAVSPKDTPLVRLQLQVVGGVDLRIRSTSARHRRVPSHEALLRMAMQHKTSISHQTLVGAGGVGVGGLLPEGPISPLYPPGMEPVSPETTAAPPGDPPSTYKDPTPPPSAAASRRTATPAKAPPRSRTGGGGPRLDPAALVNSMHGQPSVEHVRQQLVARQQEVACASQDQRAQRGEVEHARRQEANLVYGERFSVRRERLRRASIYGRHSGWDVRAVIVKTGDDCRQELLAVQLVQAFADVFQEASLPLWLRSFEVLVTSNKTALIQVISNCVSIHQLKARTGCASLREHFCDKYTEGSPEFHKAQRNFVESMASYSIICYLLQIKDRHNGNIMIDDEGHVVHIDFGFMLSNSPGGVNFESAPFKLTRELLEVMDSNSEGKASELFDYFKVLMIQGFLVCRKHADRILLLVEMMQHSGCPCFKAGPRAVQALRRRFHLNLTDTQCVEMVLGLISDSLDAWRTRQYDYYQRVLNGIL